jgi:tetratricopeptide (TPR) repeat protein
MRQSIALLLALSCLTVAAVADSGSPDTHARIAFGSEAARPHLAEAISLMDGMAPNPKIREAAEKAVAADPNSAIAHYILGTTYFGDDAKPHFEKAAALAAKASEGERQYLEAILLQRSGKNDEAIAAFKSLREKWPGDPLVALALGDLYQTKGEFHHAHEEAEAAVNLAPNSARAHALLGGVLISVEDYPRARAEFETARTHLAEGAVPGSVWFGIATSYVYESKPKPAVETLQAFLDSYRKAGAGASFPEVFIWNAMARIQLESGDPKASIQTYEKGFESVKAATNLSERDKKIWEGRLHHGRGRSLARMGQPKEAWAEAEIVKKMIDAAGDDAKEFVPSYHYLAGYLKLEAKEIPAAIDELKLAQDHDDPFRALLLARAYEKAGRKDDAIATYEKVVDTKRNSLERALAFPEAKRKLLAAGIHAAFAGGSWRLVAAAQRQRFGDPAMGGALELVHGTVPVVRMNGRVVSLGDDCVLFDRPLVGGGAFFAACGDRSPALLVKRYEGGEGQDEKWKLDEDGLYRTLNGKQERISREEAKRVALAEGPFKADWDKGVKFPARSDLLKTEPVASTQ